MRNVNKRKLNSVSERRFGRKERLDAKSIRKEGMNGFSQRRKEGNQSRCKLEEREEEGNKKAGD